MSISPKRIARFLSSIAILLVLLHLATEVVKLYGGHGNQFGFQRQFNLNEENNIPTWFSSTMLLISAALLAVIGWTRRGIQAPDAGGWLSLGGLFLYLSIDEAASLHEMTHPLGETILQRTHLLNPFLFYSWLPFGIAAVVIIGFLYRPFLKTLPADTRRRFVLAGCLYVSGVIVTEMIGSAMDTAAGRDNLAFAFEIAIEEALEMFGVITFIFALLTHLQRKEITSVLTERLLGLLAAQAAPDAGGRAAIDKPPFALHDRWDRVYPQQRSPRPLNDQLADASRRHKTPSDAVLE